MVSLKKGVNVTEEQERTFTVLIKQQANTANPVTPRAEDEKVQGSRSWDISHSSTSMLHPWEMRKRGKEEKTTLQILLTLQSMHCPFHRATLSFAGPQPAIAMD